MTSLPDERKLEWQAELRIRIKMKAENDRRIDELEQIIRTFWPEDRR
jgi:hypothetical protein